MTEPTEEEIKAVARAIDREWDRMPDDPPTNAAERTARAAILALDEHRAAEAEQSST